MDVDRRRVFFAFEAVAPWPEILPEGRLLRESDRHMTVAFLGSVDFEKLMDVLKTPPQMPFRVGLTGTFDKNLFLPPRRPSVVAWHANFGKGLEPLQTFAKSFIAWLQNCGFSPDNPDRKFLPHVTLCRSPFDFGKWRKMFTPLPMALKGLHLYESVGNLIYEKRWEYSIKAPFEEIEHTADIAFVVRGENRKQLHQNAKAALAFHHPPFLEYFDDTCEENLDDIIISLNDAVTRMDADQGCPFKAVSFHGDIIEESDQTLTWEMIIDV